MAFDGKQIRNATIVGAKLANLTITDAQLADNAVATAKILDQAVVSDKLADSSVVEAKIADNAVTAGKISSGAVTEAKLGAASVTAAKIANDAVTTDAILDAAITADKLADDAVAGAKLADGSVTLAKLADNSVDSSKIVDASITGANIANDTVAAANLVTAYESTLLYRDGSRALSGSLDLGTGNKIVNLANPEQAQDAATKAYVDSVTSSLDLKASVRVATTGDIVLGGATTEVDGVTLAQDDRVLAKQQSTATQNGIWVVNTSGAWTRAADANTAEEVTAGLFTFVEEGDVNKNTGWVLTTTGPVTFGTTELTFTQFSGAGSYLPGTGLILTGNQFKVAFNDTDQLGYDEEAWDDAIEDATLPGSAGVSNLVARADHSHALNEVAIEAILENVETDYLRLDGNNGPISGTLDMGGNPVIGLTDPTDPQGAATKAYVDAQIITAGGGAEISNKRMVAEVTTADGNLACNDGMAFNAKGYVQVFVNGIKVNVTGDVEGDCYFSADGTLAKALDSVKASDKLYWNGSVAQYELSADDLIDFDYIASLEMA
jgi:hypothetical protein